MIDAYAVSCVINFSHPARFCLAFHLFIFITHHGSPRPSLPPLPLSSQYIGRVVCLVRSPLDYLRARLYPTINKVPFASLDALIWPYIQAPQP